MELPTLKAVRDPSGREIAGYTWQETGIDLKRIVGGLAWPNGEIPGFACVIGETPSLRPPYHRYLLAEIEEADIFKLIERCNNLKGPARVDDFYGRRHDPAIRLLQLWNREAEHLGKRTFHISSAPFSEDGSTAYHVNVIKSCLKPESETLHLPEGCLLREHLLRIPRAEVGTASDLQYPAVASLGYALAHLVLNEPHLNLRREPSRARIEYDPFTYQLGGRNSKGAYDPWK